MTKKHFISLAAALAKAKIDPARFESVRDHGIAMHEWRNLVDETIAVWRATNPNFDAARFRSACGDDRR